MPSLFMVCRDGGRTPCFVWVPTDLFFLYMHCLTAWFSGWSFWYILYWRALTANVKKKIIHI